MFAMRVQLSVATLKASVSLMPKSDAAKPPMTRMRPSAIMTCPEQKIADIVLVTAVNVWLVGSQTRAETLLVSQASHITMEPLGNNPICTATIGQFSTADHWPTVAADEEEPVVKTPSPDVANYPFWPRLFQ